MGFDFCNSAKIKLRDGFPWRDMADNETRDWFTKHLLDLYTFKG